MQELLQQGLVVRRLEDVTGVSKVSTPPASGPVVVSRPRVYRRTLLPRRVSPGCREYLVSPSRPRVFLVAGSVRTPCRRLGPRRRSLVVVGSSGVVGVRSHDRDTDRPDVGPGPTRNGASGNSRTPTTPTRWRIFVVHDVSPTRTLVSLAHRPREPAVLKQIEVSRLVARRTCHTDSGSHPVGTETGGPRCRTPDTRATTHRLVASALRRRDSLTGVGPLTWPVSLVP